LYRGKGGAAGACGVFVLHYPFPLDEDKMRDARRRLVGTRFRIICGLRPVRRGHKERSTIREIYSTEWSLGEAKNGIHRVWPVVLADMVRKMLARCGRRRGGWNRTISTSI